MNKILIISFGCLLIWVLASVAVADTRYFDQWGNEVSYQQYQKTVQAWYARLDELKGPKVKTAVTSLGTAPATAPAPAQRTTASAPSFLAPTVKNTAYADTVPRDSKGRPLKDEKGRWLTYQDEIEARNAAKKREAEDYISAEEAIAFMNGASGMHSVTLKP